MPHHKNSGSFISRISIKDRFEKKVCKGSNGCLEWTAQILPTGYGRFKMTNGTAVMAHRISYEIFVGPIPKNKWILHSCDNRKCVNPQHLRLGTHQENMDDLSNRLRGALGTKNVKSKLNDFAVKDIRKRFSDGENVVSLAKEYGVTPAAACMAICKYTWRHIQ